MTKYKIYMLVLLISFTSLFSFNCLAQASTVTGSTDSMHIENSSFVKEKKKDKNYVRDDVQINETFFVSLLINLLTIAIIVRFIYHPNYRKQEVFFTYFLFNITIFLLTFLLNKVKISMGAAFGLFAVFSMLRYRTEGISMKDMTYLFIVIAVGLVSAIQLDYLELCIVNGIIILMTFILDGNLIIKREFTQTINYEKLELIKLDQQSLLISDLKERTGLDIKRVSIVKIDFTKNMAVIEIYYQKNRKGSIES